MDLFNAIFVIIPLYCIVDGVMMLVRGTYNEKQLERYARYTDESVAQSVKPNAIIYITLGVVFSIWNLVDYGTFNLPSYVEIALMVVIALIIVATVIYNKKTLKDKPGYIAPNSKKKMF